MTHLVFVDGQEGTTGLRIHEMLAGRADVEVLRIAPERRRDTAERARLLNAADVAFLCLPDAAARESAALVTNPRTCVIDASTAHRTDPDWVFGLPELCPGQRERIAAATRISNPGCHSTAFLLLARPLVDAGILDPATPLAATSITGYSGGGKRMIEQYEAGGDARLMSPRPYGLMLAHKHVPEMMVQGRLAQAPIFVPVVASFLKGLAVTLPLHLSQLRAGTTGAAIQDALFTRYAHERFIQVATLNKVDALDGGFFDVQACNDTNRADIFVFANDRQVVLMARIDNLGKGASGAAVQSMNLRLGLDEGTGL